MLLVEVMVHSAFTAPAGVITRRCVVGCEGPHAPARVVQVGMVTAAGAAQEQGIARQRPAIIRGLQESIYSGTVSRLTSGKKSLNSFDSRSSSRLSGTSAPCQSSTGSPT